MDYGLWKMNYGLWTMDYELWTMDYGLWTTNYGLWTMVRCTVGLLGGVGMLGRVWEYNTDPPRCYKDCKTILKNTFFSVEKMFIFQTPEFRLFISVFLIC